MASPSGAGQPPSDKSPCQADETPPEQQEEVNRLQNVASSEQLCGGFNCEFVERPQELQTDCPICLLVLREPFQVNCCGNSFCRTCIERILTNEKACPTCKGQFRAFENKGLQRALYSFRVRCVHQGSGCEWTGELRELERHLNLDPELGKQLVGCAFAAVACSYCREYFQRCDVHAHESEACPQRPFSCDYCEYYKSVYEDVVNNHWPVCKCYPVPCPNECEVSPERQNVEIHVNTECPLTLVNCDFHYAGCEVQLLRKDMPTHLAKSQSLAAHISLLTTQTQMLTDTRSGQDGQELLPHLSLLALHNQQLTRLTLQWKDSLEESQHKIQEFEKEKQTQATVNAELQNWSEESKHEIEVLKKTLKQKTLVNKDVMSELRRQQRESLEEFKKQYEALEQKLNRSVEQEMAELRTQQRESLEESQQEIEELKGQTQAVITQLQISSEGSRSETETLRWKMNEDIEQELAKLGRLQKESLEESQHKIQELERQIQAAVVTELQKYSEVSSCEIEALKLKLNQDVEQEMTELRRQLTGSLEDLKQKVKEDMQLEVADLQKESWEESQHKIQKLEKEKEAQVAVIADLQKCSKANKHDIDALKMKMNKEVKEEVRKQKESLQHKIQELEREKHAQVTELQQEIEALKQKMKEDMDQEMAELRRQQKESREESHHERQELEQATKQEIEALKQKMKEDMDQEMAELRRQQKESREEIHRERQELEQATKQEIEALKQKMKEDMDQEMAELRRQQKESREESQRERQELEQATKQEIEALKQKMKEDMDQEMAELRRQQKESREESQREIQELEREKQSQAAVIAELQECSTCKASQHEIEALKLKVNNAMEQDVAGLRIETEQLRQEVSELKQGAAVSKSETGLDIDTLGTEQQDSASKEETEYLQGFEELKQETISKKETAQSEHVIDELRQRREESSKGETEKLKQEVIKLRKKQKEADILKYEVSQLKQRQQELMIKREAEVGEFKQKQEEIEGLKKEVFQLKTDHKELENLKQQRESLEESQREIQELERKMQAQAAVIAELQKYSEASKCEIEALNLKVNKQEMTELRRRQESLEESQHKINVLEREKQAQSVVVTKEENQTFKTEFTEDQKPAVFHHEVPDIREETQGLEQTTLRTETEQLRQEVSELKQGAAVSKSETGLDIDTLGTEQQDSASKEETEYLQVSEELKQETISKKETAQSEHVIDELRQRREESSKGETEKLKQEVDELRKKQKEADILKYEVSQLKQRQQELMIKREAEVGEFKQKQEEIEGLKKEVFQLKTDHKELENIRQDINQIRMKQEQNSFSMEFTMSNFSKHKKANDCWSSHPFHTYPHRYKLCLDVYANGFGDCKGTHVSIYARLLQGEFDDYLEWPFLGDIVIQLVNQLDEDKHPHEAAISFSDEIPSAVASRVTAAEQSESGWGYEDFISQDELGYNQANACQYLSDDCLTFRVMQARPLDLIQEITTLRKSVEQLKIEKRSACELQPYSSLLFDNVDSKGKTISWQDIGIMINIPPDATPEDIVVRVQAQCFLPGPGLSVILPENVQLASPVYRISATPQFVNKVELSIAHFAAPDSEDDMTFLHSSDRSPPYHFQLVPGGTFIQHGTYGSLWLNSFCKYAVGRRKRTASERGEGTPKPAKRHEGMHIFRMSTCIWAALTHLPPFIMFGMN